MQRDHDENVPAPGVGSLVDVVLEAIGRTKVAERRLRLAHSLVDDIGVQMAYQAVLHNLTVISVTVKEMPDDVLAQAPGTDWHAIVTLPDTYGNAYLRVDPHAIHRMVDDDLEPLDLAVRRLRAAQ